MGSGGTLSALGTFEPFHRIFLNLWQKLPQLKIFGLTHLQKDFFLK